jgi:hypothetical protein
VDTAWGCSCDITEGRAASHQELPVRSKFTGHEWPKSGRVYKAGTQYCATHFLPIMYLKLVLTLQINRITMHICGPRT